MEILVKREAQILTRTLSLLLSLLFLVGNGAACDVEPDGDSDADSEGDADGDIDGDTDADSDSDADGDGDGDGDADADQEPDADIERDLSRCGTGEESCSDCHGGMATGGPPPDLQGRTETTEITVGAHGRHFIGSASSAAVACNECHRLPASVFALRHCDSPEPAEVRYGEIATQGGMYPAWNRDEGTCSMVYCHGATLDGGRNPSPSWTGGGPLGCGDCHAENYHGLTVCDCHGTVWADGEIIAPERHVDGYIDM